MKIIEGIRNFVDNVHYYVNNCVNDGS